MTGRGVAALAGLLALAALVSLGVLRGLDVAILDAAQVPRDRAVDVVASAVTIFGQAEIAGAIALGVALVRFRARRRDAWLPLVIAVVVLVESALKLVVAQAGPPHDRSRLIELLPFLHSPFGNSFPSGHVARTAFLLAIAPRLPRWAHGVAIALMSVTRLYLAEHWATDVAGGLLLGYGVAWLALGAFSRPRVTLGTSGSRERSGS